MKILFDATELSYFNENSGHKAGVYYVALNLLKELSLMGIDITLHCDYKRYYFLKKIKDFKNYNLLEEHSLTNRFIGKLLYIIDKAPLRLKYAVLIMARIYDAYFYKKNKKNTEQLKEFDAYFSPFTPPTKEIQESSLKKYRMLHDVIPIIENGYPKTPKDWYFKIYNTINNNDYYFTNSEYTKQDVLKLFPSISEKRIKTTLLGANSDFYPSKENLIGEKYIFSLCTLGKRKNLIFAIKNFFTFIEKHQITDLKLVIGGGIWDKYKKELNSALNKFDKSKIIITGYIAEDDLKKYYSNALCFIYPSLYEGFGLPVLEAMQCGCPTITSCKSSLPEVIGDCGILIDPTVDNDLIEAFEKMYFDSDFRKSCAEKGITRAKTFSWEKCAKEIYEFVKSTL